MFDAIASFLIRTLAFDTTFLLAMRSLTDPFLLQEMLEVDVMTLKVLDESLSLRFDFLALCNSSNRIGLTIDLASQEALRLHREDRAID